MQDLNIKYLHLHISIHVYVYLYMCLGYSSACGAELIRFSYSTNMLHAGYEQKRKHVDIYDFLPQLAVNNIYLGSMASYYIHKTTTLILNFILNSNFLYSKGKLYMEHFDTTDADLSFSLS